MIHDPNEHIQTSRQNDLFSHVCGAFRGIIARSYPARDRTRCAFLQRHDSSRESGKLTKKESPNKVGASIPKQSPIVGIRSMIQRETIALRLVTIAYVRRERKFFESIKVREWASWSSQSARL